METAKILVVEDDVSEAQTLAELLRAWGYQSDLAVDGVEALAKIISLMPSLVIADVCMPRMDGLRLLRELGQRFPDVPCILISGQSSLEEAIAGINLGAYRFLEKPVDPGRLRLEIQACLQ